MSAQPADPGLSIVGYRTSEDFSLCLGCSQKKDLSVYRVGSVDKDQPITPTAKNGVTIRDAQGQLIRSGLHYEDFCTICGWAITKAHAEATFAQDASKAISAPQVFPTVESSPTQATEPNSSTPASVWILTEESNGSSGDGPDNVVLGVFATKEAADAEEAVRVQQRHAEGLAVSDDEEAYGEWDYSYNVEEHQVQR